MDFDLFGKDCPSPIKRSPTPREDQEKQVVFKRVVVEKVSTVPHVLVGEGFCKCRGLWDKDKERGLLVNACTCMSVPFIQGGPPGTVGSEEAN